jgi:hypothetical protein
MKNRPEYDISTAVTFLMAGLGIGSLLAILFTPRPRAKEFVPLREGQRVAS